MSNTETTVSSQRRLTTAPQTFESLLWCRSFDVFFWAKIVKMVSMTDADAKGKTGNGSSAVPVVDLSDDSNSGSNAHVPIGGKPSAGAG